MYAYFIGSDNEGKITTFQIITVIRKRVYRYHRNQYF